MPDSKFIFPVSGVGRVYEVAQPSKPLHNTATSIDGTVFDLEQLKNVLHGCGYRYTYKQLKERLESRDCTTKPLHRALVSSGSKD